MGRIETNFKQTEVGLIPEDWEVKELKDIGECIIGLTYSPSNVRSYGVLVLRSSNVQNGRLSFDDNVFVDMDLPQRVIVKESDILICARNGSKHLIGKCALINKKTSGSAFGAFMSVYRGEFPKLVFHQFRSDIIQKQIEETLGATINQITNKDLRSFRVVIPTNKTEQTAIANALSDADGYIESLEKLIDKKQKIKQGSLQQLLKPKENWEVKSIGEVAEVERGASPRPIEDPKWFDNNSLIGWVRISDVTSSTKILQFTTQKLSDLGIKNSRYVERGNLIMSICATIGRPILTRIDVCIHDGFVVFRKPTINKEYLYYFLSFIEKDWSKNGQTGSQMNLNTNLIKKTEIYLPPTKTEQQQIAQILSDIDNEINILNQKLTKAKAIKQGMMQQLLTGKIRLI